MSRKNSRHTAKKYCNRPKYCISRTPTGETLPPSTHMVLYDTRVLAIPLCLCLSQVSLSQVGVLSKGMNGLIWFLARRLFSTIPTLCFKQTRVSTKTRILPSGTFLNSVPIVERGINLARERWTLTV